MRRGLYDFADGASRMFRRRRRRQQANSGFSGRIRGQIRENRDLVGCRVKRHIGSAGLRLRSSRQIIALAIHHNFVRAVCAEEIRVDVIFLCQGCGKHWRFCRCCWNPSYRRRNLRGLFGALAFPESSSLASVSLAAVARSDLADVTRVSVCCIGAAAFGSAGAT